ncbi:hypothetical protein CDAR_411131 [Caerostris darwini]|uniref:Transmembrane protein n=1 Tax=Caerostris darwini TaxID=1538125 RepID=A0AAV4SF97_9ARAC|nr:hypothetical protein CDAR_411131 [Caerostris darwini]
MTLHYPYLPIRIRQEECGHPRKRWFFRTGAGNFGNILSTPPTLRTLLRSFAVAVTVFPFLIFDGGGGGGIVVSRFRKEEGNSFVEFGVVHEGKARYGTHNKQWRRIFGSV